MQLETKGSPNHVQDETLHIECPRKDECIDCPYAEDEAAPRPDLSQVSDRIFRVQRRGGRACEVCAQGLERRLSQVDGILRANASYQAGVLSLTYDRERISVEQIEALIGEYGGELAPCAAEAEEQERELAQASWWQRARNWLTEDRLELIFTVVTFFTMIGGLISERAGAPRSVTLAIFAVAYFAGGTFGVRAGLQSLRQFTVDIDLLMVLAAIGAWLVGSPFEGAMLLFLFSLSNVLQSYALDRTRNAIRALMKLRPKEALTRRNGKTEMVPIDQLELEDVVIVRPGERIPIDGVVVEGETTVDQSSITGESMPVGKEEGDAVLAGTMNQSGSIEIRVTKLAQDTTIAKMIKLVEAAQSEKARTQRFLDSFEQYYAWGVIIFTVLVAVVPVYFWGETFNTAFYRAMTVMVAASPCALVISTPAAILSAIGNGARRGILFKGGVHLEQTATIKVVAFDKTGTLTEGKPHVTDIEVFSLPHIDWEGSIDELLSTAAAVEARSEHPLAQAIVREAEDRDLPIPDVTSFKAETGKGVHAEFQGKSIRIGSQRYIESVEVGNLDAVLPSANRMQDSGVTPVFVAQDIADSGVFVLGVIGVADVLRDTVPATIRALKKEGVKKVVMLTGDNDRVAQAIAKEAGVDEFYANLLPEDKVDIVKMLQAQYGVVAMVGDGVNDAPALAASTVGIAMGAAGTDVAMETANVVLLSNELKNIPYAIALSKHARHTLIANLSIALALIAVMLIGIFAIQLPLPLAVVGHEGGTVLVSLNGVRLLAYKNDL
jgi:Zn2+/Cd2+-exporting ATPase